MRFGNQFSEVLWAALWRENIFINKKKHEETSPQIAIPLDLLDFVNFPHRIMTSLEYSGGRKERRDVNRRDLGSSSRSQEIEG